MAAIASGVTGISCTVQRTGKEDCLLKRNSKVFLAFFVLIFVVLVFLFARTAVTKPADSIVLTPIPPGEYSPEAWGKHYPLQYKSYLRNHEMTPSPTGYGGSVKFQHSIKQPEILLNFKGMAFSKDYTEDRGHPYSLEDLKETKRITPSSPGACITCKTANLGDIYRELGWSYAKQPLSQIFPRATHAITCATCHDPATMSLRVINPAFLEAMAKKGVDMTKASRDEMRSYVCAQCHVEYYFEPGTTRVVLPWDKGLQVNQIFAYYEGTPSGFLYDWIHPDSQARMLKAQHPDYETWSGGVHAKSGVSCADCHMPFMREKGKKYTSHWVSSPLKYAKEACSPCHDQSTDWLIARVKSTQDSAWQLQHRAGTVVARAHEAIGRTEASGRYDRGELEKARQLVRKAQWYWDFVAAENSMGFHNPVQTLATLGQSIDMAYEAILAANKAAGSRR